MIHTVAQRNRVHNVQLSWRFSYGVRASIHVHPYTHAVPYTYPAHTETSEVVYRSIIIMYVNIVLVNIVHV